MKAQSGKVQTPEADTYVDFIFYSYDINPICQLFTQLLSPSSEEIGVIEKGTVRVKSYSLLIFHLTCSLLVKVEQWLDIRFTFVRGIHMQSPA